MAEVKLSCLEAQFILRLLDEKNVALERVAKLLDENLREENDPTGILIIQLAHKGIDAENLLIRHVSPQYSSWIRGRYPPQIAGAFAACHSGRLPSSWVNSQRRMEGQDSHHFELVIQRLLSVRHAKADTDYLGERIRTDWVQPAQRIAQTSSQGALGLIRIELDKEERVCISNLLALVPLDPIVSLKEGDLRDQLGSLNERVLHSSSKRLVVESIKLLDRFQGQTASVDRIVRLVKRWATQAQGRCQQLEKKAEIAALPPGAELSPLLQPYAMIHPKTLEPLSKEQRVRAVGNHQPGSGRLLYLRALGPFQIPKVKDLLHNCLQATECFLRSGPGYEEIGLQILQTLTLHLPYFLTAPRSAQVGKELLSVQQYPEEELCQFQQRVLRLWTTCFPSRSPDDINLTILYATGLRKKSNSSPSWRERPCRVHAGRVDHGPNEKR
ncbi:unnamed protein product [Sphagnum tenellum]